MSNETKNETLQRLEILGLPDVAGYVMDLQQENQNLRAEVERVRNLAYAINDEAKELHQKCVEDARTILRLESQYGVQYDRAEKLLNERDEARMEVCDLSGNGSCDSAEREAEARGWQYLFGNENPTYICDHCGDTTDSDNVFHYAEVPQDIASANKGESATVCRKCEKMIEANANNDHFRENHK